jgi:hypothetical protein
MCNEKIGETRRSDPWLELRCAGFLQRFGNDRRNLHDDAVGLQKVPESLQHSLFLPSASEHPEEFRQYDERNKHTTILTFCFDDRAGLLGLWDIVVELGPRPHICIGCNHRDCLRALAAFISSNDMMPSGLPPSSAIFQGARGGTGLGEGQTD